MGTLAFGSLLYLSGAAPWSLPAVYLAFAAVALPYRAIEFGLTRNAPFLLDFCYVRSLPPSLPPHHVAGSCSALTYICVSDELMTRVGRCQRQVEVLQLRALVR